MSILKLKPYSPCIRTGVIKRPAKRFLVRFAYYDDVVRVKTTLSYAAVFLMQKNLLLKSLTTLVFCFTLHLFT